MAFRTQKISQMAPKGSDLEATDLIEVSTIESGSYVTRSITGQELIDAIPAASVEWGDIGGTLSDQTDLNTALNGKVPTSRTLTINGTTQDLSANRTFTVATGITIGTTAITSGAVGRVLFEGAGNVVQESANLFWDNTNGRLGIGTSSPTNTLTLGAAVAASMESSAATLFTSKENASNVFTQVAASNEPLHRPVFSGTKARGTLLSPLAVQAGDAITTFLSSAYDGASGQASAALSFDAESNASSGNAPQLISFITGASGATRTTKMQVRSNGNLLINTTTDAGFRLDVNGTARITRDLTIGTSTTGVNTNITISSPNLNAGILTFNNADSTVQGSLLATGSLLTFGTYQGNQANLIGGTGGVALRTNNGANAHIRFYSGNANADSSTEQMRIVASTGNLLINTTTDAGFRLDVNGTFRVNSGNGSRIEGGGSFTATGFCNFNGASQAVAGTNATRLNAQTDLSVGFAGGAAASAVFEAQSTTKGFLPPRMTTTQKNAIASPATGLVLYDTTLNKLCVRTASAWETITSA